MRELMSGRWKCWALATTWFVFAAAACAGSASSAENKIKDLVAQMEKAGLECSDLAIEDPGPIRDSPTGAPVAIKVGSCILDSGSQIGGLSIATRILIFEDESHTEFLPPPEVLAGQALVYGDTWEIFVTPADMGEEVQRATDGQLITGPEEFPVPTTTP